MTGKELIEKYRNGERNFIGAYLVGAYLVGANLDGAKINGAILTAVTAIGLGVVVPLNLLNTPYRCRECECGLDSGYTDTVIVELAVVVSEDGKHTDKVLIRHPGNEYWTEPMTLEELEQRRP